MKIITESLRRNTFLKQKELNKNLIFETVYFNEYFERLINKCFTTVLSESIMYLSGIEIKNLVDNKRWKDYCKFDITKNLLIYVYNDNLEDLTKFVSLTNTEKTEIEKQISADYGCFCSDFENNKDLGLILINQNTDIIKLKTVLTHELIHYFQWNLKHSIILRTNKKVNNKIILNITETLNISEMLCKELIREINDGKELETYVNTIFYQLKFFCKQNELKFNKLVISAICESFNNINIEQTFNEYFEKVKIKLKKFNEKFIKLLESDSIIFLLLLGYFKTGFNSFKNHLYSYFDKEIK